MRRLPIALAVLLAAAVPAHAEWNEANVPGAREHRLLPFYPQARVSAYEMKDFDGQRMLVAYDKGAPEPAAYEEVEGRVIQYRTEHRPTASVLEILRNYETALKAKGFQAVVSGRGSAFPGLDLGQDETIGVWRLQEPGGTVWLTMHAWYSGGARELPVSEVVIVEPEAMEQRLGAGAQPR